jgi:hypothetical protein
VKRNKKKKTLLRVSASSPWGREGFELEKWE